MTAAHRSKEMFVGVHLSLSMCVLINSWQNHVWNHFAFPESVPFFQHQDEENTDNLY